MKNTNVILYPPGAYGNFINWCCSYFNKDLTNIEIPMTELGSVHNYFPGQHLLLSDNEVIQYIDSSDVYNFLQLHDNVLCFDLLIDQLSILSINFQKIIYIYTTPTSKQWLTNNCYYKIQPFDDLIRLNLTTDPQEWLSNRGIKPQSIKHLKEIGIDRLRSELSDEVNQKATQWNCNDINELAIWELRELCANYFYDRINSSILTIDQINILKGKFNNICFIRLDGLRDNFANTIETILDFFNIPVDNPTEEIQQIYQNWKSKQYYIDSDQYVNNIVNAIINNTNLDWSNYNLTFFDEIAIQRKLLDNKIELACYNLNVFPTNTKDFQPILIK